MLRTLPLSLLVVLWSCNDKAEDPTREPVYLTAGAPMAGVADVVIDFPMGAPMGGYSNRCDYLGRNGAVDNRRSPYTEAWSSSSGIQTRARAKALWLTNGDQDLVIIKADVIYAFDNIVREVEKELSETTGRDMEGRVVLTASHTHNAPANYSDSYHFYLGGDRYNEEVFQRFTSSLVEASLDAWESIEPAAIGMGITEDWDPDDLVYADRRPENDELQVWDDQTPGTKKDPQLWVFRIDNLSGEPLGVFFNFGVHGTVLGASNSMVSTDAPGHVELALQEHFDSSVVVAHWQGSAGDATPRGTDNGYARMESVGDYAADSIYNLWDSTPTNTQPILLETVTQSIQEDLDTIRVQRSGEKELSYLPFQEGRIADNKVYESDGSIASPIDEFNAEYGGAFCGYEEPLVSTGTIGTTIFPYDGCMQVELVSWLIAGVFDLGADSIPLPLPSSQQALTTASRIGPIDILQADGSVITDDAYIGFFPGEVTQMYTEQYQRRAAAEYGLENVFVVGYAQDHEGYLMIPEDWLIGGYEPNINIWGPLQGEHIMEGNLSMVWSHLSTTRLEPHDPHNEFPDTEYVERELPTKPPEKTPEAGTQPTSLPEEVWTPIELIPQVAPESVIPRIQGIAQMAWIGGDPGVDIPVVELERLEGEVWTVVRTPAGHDITDSRPEILTTHTPDPLYPWDAVQTHYWWAGWQAVGTGDERTSIAAGVYRFHVYGQTFTGDSETWPWDTTDYEITSDPFEVVPATISVSVEDGSIRASLPGPSNGFRLIDIDGDSQGPNPVRDATIVWTMDDGSTINDPITGNSIVDGSTLYETEPPAGAVRIDITDTAGNTGGTDLL
jgi:neutral ceramidase